MLPCSAPCDHAPLPLTLSLMLPLRLMKTLLLLLLQPTAGGPLLATVPMTDVLLVSAVLIESLGSRLIEALLTMEPPPVQQQHDFSGCNVLQHGP